MRRMPIGPEHHSLQKQVNQLACLQAPSHGQFRMLDGGALGRPGAIHRERGAVRCDQVRQRLQRVACRAARGHRCQRHFVACRQLPPTRRPARLLPAAGWPAGPLTTHFRAGGWPGGHQVISFRHSACSWAPHHLPAGLCWRRRSAAALTPSGHPRRPPGRHAAAGPHRPPSCSWRSTCRLQAATAAAAAAAEATAAAAAAGEEGAAAACCCWTC